LVNPGQQAKEAQGPEVPAEEQAGTGVDVGAGVDVGEGEGEGLGLQALLAQP